MNNNIHDFLKSKEGQSITLLTKSVYLDVSFPHEIKVIKFHSKINHLDVMYLEFKEYDVFVFQGTSCLIDWVADAKMALGIIPRQFKTALRFVKKHIKDDRVTYISGHSLGGAIAEYVTHNLKDDYPLLQGVAYNGAGIKHLVAKKHRTNVPIYNFISDKDILNNILRVLPSIYFKHLGESLILEDKVSANCWKAHSNFAVFK